MKNGEEQHRVEAQMRFHPVLLLVCTGGDRLWGLLHALGGVVAHKEIDKRGMGEYDKNICGVEVDG